MTEGPEIPEESSADVLTHRDAVSSARRIKAVVTGSAGFIGSHICDAFLALGCDVVGVDNLSSKVDNTPQNVHRLSDRIPEPSCDVLSLTRPDLEGANVVVHAAAYADVRGNWEGADGGLAARSRLIESNVLTTAHLLEVLPPTAAFVLLSTAAVYGTCLPQHAGVASRLASENQVRIEDILSPYAASKLAAEALVAAYGRRHGFRWFALRLVNVIGSRTHHGVVSDFVRMMQKNGRISTLDNGAEAKSWVHVRDVADAVTTIAGRLDAPSGVYNVSSADMISWWDVVDAMGVPRGEVLYPPSRVAGHLGDPVGLTVSARKLSPFYRCDRPVRAGIHEALYSLGWRYEK